MCENILKPPGQTSGPVPALSISHGKANRAPGLGAGDLLPSLLLLLGPRNLRKTEEAISFPSPEPPVPARCLPESLGCCRCCHYLYILSPATSENTCWPALGSDSSLSASIMNLAEADPTTSNTSQGQRTKTQEGGDVSRAEPQ